MLETIGDFVTNGIATLKGLLKLELVKFQKLERMDSIKSIISLMCCGIVTLVHESLDFIMNHCYGGG